MATQQIKINLLFDANTKAAQNNINKLSQLLSQIDKETVIGVDDGSLMRATEAARQLQIHLQNSVNVNTGKINLSNLNSSLKSTNMDLQTLVSHLQGAGPIGQQAFIKLATAVSSAELPVKRTNQHIADLIKTLSNTAKWQAASMAIHAVQGALSNAISYAKDLNKALSDIRVVTGYSAKAMADFAEDASKAAKELNTTAAEYSKAALIFYQQGLTGGAVEERTNIVIKLSQVTGQSAKIVSDQMTAIWNNFDDGSKSLEYYADALTKLGAVTAASTEEIATGLEKFAAIADTVGLSYETATAAIATVVDKTRQSADVVGTAFKTIFARMEGLTLGETLDDGVTLNKYSEALAAVGIEVLNTSGELRQMDDLLDELGEKWQYFSQETKVALAQTVGGIRQYNQMLALMDNWQDVEKNIKLASSATGELINQQRIWSQSYEAAAERAKRSAQEVYSTLIEDKGLIAFQDVFSSFLSVISNIIDSMGGLIPLVLKIAGLFSASLLPIISKGFSTFLNNLKIGLGIGRQEAILTQEMVKKSLEEELKNNQTLTDATKKQLALSHDLLSAKQRLLLMSKNMSEAEREEAEGRMAIYEAMVSEAQASLDLQDKLEKSKKQTEEKLTSGGNRTILASYEGSKKFADKTQTLPEDEKERDTYVESLRVEAITKSSKQIEDEKAAFQKQQSIDYAQKRKDLKDKISNAEDILTTPNNNLTEEQINEQSSVIERYQKELAELVELEEAEKAQVTRYDQILELQKEIGIAARKSAGELKKVSVGTIDSFHKDAQYKGQSGIDLATKSDNSIGAKAVTGEEMLTQATESLVVAGTDGKQLDVTLEGFEKIIVAMSNYKNQAQELNIVLKDSTIFQQDNADQIVQAASMVDAYEAELQALRIAEQEEAAAMRAVAEAQEAVNTTGKKDKSATEALKKAKEQLSKAIDKVRTIQAKQDKEFKGSNKNIASYTKQLSSLRTVLTNAAKTSKNASKEIKNINAVFEKLTSVDTAAEGIQDLQKILQRFGGGSQEAADGLDALATTMHDKLIEQGMDENEINTYINTLEELGAISPEIASKMRQIGNAGEELGKKTLKGGELVTSVFSEIATGVSTLTTAYSAIKSLTVAFTEANTPLETMEQILSSMVMLIPLVVGGIKIWTAVSEINKRTTDALNITKLVGVGVDKKATKAKWAEFAAESSLLSVKIMAAAVEKFGIAGTIVGIAAIGAATAAIIGGTAAYTAHAEAQQKSNETQLQENQNLVEAIDKTQELSESVRDLTKEYEKLAKAGENTTETLGQMNEKIPELITSYRSLAKSIGGNTSKELSAMTDDLEHFYNVAQLTGDWSAFNSTKDNIDQLIATTEYQTAMSGGAIAGKKGAESMEKAVGGSVKKGKLTLNVGGVDTMKGRGEEYKAQDILKEKMGSYYSESNAWGKVGANLAVDYSSAAEFTDYYTKLQEAYSAMSTELSKEELERSDIAREIRDALEAGKEQYDEMLPLANAQIDSSGKLIEAYLSAEQTIKSTGEETIGLKPENINTLQEYIVYKKQFVEIAEKEYGLTKAQAEAYLKEMDSLSQITTEYELASIMMSKFGGIDVNSLAPDSEVWGAMNKLMTDTFGELSEEEMSIAVSIAATSNSMDEFSEQLQQALVVSMRKGLEESQQVVLTTLANAAETGKIDFTDLFNDDNFTTYLENLNMSREALVAQSYEEQYRIISDFYAKVQELEYDSYSSQQELYYQSIAQTQRELNAVRAQMKSPERAQDIATAQEDYTTKQEELEKATSDSEKAKIQRELNEMAENFKKEYAFSIDSNIEDLENELDNLFDKIDELQDKKIEMAMDWSGTDQVEASLEKTAEFAKIIQKDTKKVGDNYVMTAKQAKEWLKFYPELGAIAETTEDGLIQLNQEKVNAFIDGNEIQLDSSIDTQIKELEAQKASIQAEIELRKIDLEAAQTFADGELKIEGVSAEYLTEMRKNLTNYYIELGYDEIEANNKALEIMKTNEDEYTKAVSAACETQAENIAASASAGATAQAKSLGETAKRWFEFGQYLITNIGPVLVKLGKAIIDPSISLSDAIKEIQEDSGFSKKVEVTADYEPILSEDNTLNLKSTEKEAINAVYKQVGEKQKADIQTRIDELTKGLNNIDSQIDYLNALKNLDLADVGDDSIGTEEIEMMAEAMERYHELTREVQALEREIKKYDKAQEEAFGADKIKIINDKKKALDDLYKTQNSLNAAQLGNLVTDTDNLKSLFSTNLEIDDYKNLSNWTDLRKEAENTLNAARKTYNDSNQDEDDKKALEEAEKYYEKQIEALEQYEQTVDEFNESAEAAEATLAEIKALNFEEISLALELDLEINQDAIQELDYYLNKIADDSFAMSEGAGYLRNKVDLTGNNLSSYESNWSQLETKHNNKDITDSDYYGGLAKIRDGIYDELEALNSLDKEMLEYYGNTLSMAGEEITKYTTKIEQLSSVLDHYQSLLSLIGKENDFESMNIVLSGIASTANDAKNAAKAEYEFYAKQAEERKTAMENATSDAAKEALEKEWEAAEAAASEAQDRMLSSTAEWAEAMKAVTENKLKDYAQTLEKALTGDTSFDDLTTSMERASSLQEEYLTSTNQIYETTKMMRATQKVIDETTNQVAKNKLKAFMEETKYLQNQDKLSQHQLDIHQAEYELLLAEIALEEAQSAKSTVRLQRDAEGNFGYVYTADSAQVADAEQKVADAQNALYNKQLEGANDYTQKYQQTLSEMYDTMSSLQEQYLSGEIINEEEYNRRMLEAKEYYFQKLQDFSELYQISTNDNSAVIADAWSSDFADMTASTETWKVAVETYTNNCATAFTGWKSVVTEVEKETGKDLASLSEKVSSITTKSKELADELTKKDGVIDKLEGELDLVTDITNAYANQRDTLLTLIETYEKYASTINTTLAGKKVVTTITTNTEEDSTQPPPTTMDTGGYTGEWGPEGKLAVLHQKEMVLNAQDTENLLAAVDTLRVILNTIDTHSMSAQIGGMLSTPGFTGGNTETLEQNVKIEASFPGVQDRNEIEEAFNNLINRASQYANRK